MTTTLIPPRATQSGVAAAAADIDIVVPVYNEAAVLEASIRRLHTYVGDHLPLACRITIADNASTDATPAIADRLAAELGGVGVVHLAEKGRGRALRRAWGASDAAVLAYMDVDLSTDLDALLPMVAPLLSGHSDLAIGTRLSRSSRVVRGPKREIISRTYNLMLRAILRARFSDAQCGFKAIRADRARQLVPLVRDNEWFFDTELLVVAERAGLRIHEVPVDWVDDPDSRVDIVATALADMRGIARLARSLASGALPLREIAPRRALDRRLAPEVGLGRQLARFVAIGGLTTVVFAALFLAFRGALGAWWANALALVLATVANTALNRRITFGVRGPGGHARHQAQGIAVLGIALALTNGGLWIAHALAPDAGRGVELAVLTLANVAATLVKFLLFRAWVFRRAVTTIAPEVL